MIYCFLIFFVKIYYRLPQHIIKPFCFLLYVEFKEKAPSTEHIGLLRLALGKREC